MGLDDGKVGEFSEANKSKSITNGSSARYRGVESVAGEGVFD